MEETKSVPSDDPNAAFAHLVRAAIALLLTVTLPVVLYAGATADKDVLRVYIDAVTAVVAFYFGASSSSGAEPQIPVAGAHRQP
jgi:hypothetical protein